MVLIEFISLLVFPPQARFSRIEEVNLQDLELRAVIETDSSVLEQAHVLDFERLIYGPRSPLHGIPVLLKDNIATVVFEGTRNVCERITLTL